MRAIVALFIVLAVAFVGIGTSAAAPGGDVKASPLFKRSLEESIASLEGKAPKAELAKGEAEATPTSTKGCDAPYTSWGNTCSETCEPTQCGGECYTQANTCFPTVCGGTCASTFCATCQATCASTCANTCASTCANTCVGSGPTYQGGACCNARYYGTISWRNMYDGGAGYPYPSSGPSTDWTGYLSPYYVLEDMHYVEYSIGGVIDFVYGSNQFIKIANFSANNGSFDGTKTVPNVSSYSIRSYMTSYYDRQIGTQAHHYTWTDINEQPVSSKQVNQTKAIVRP
jgi:hypothetical protein